MTLTTSDLEKIGELIAASEKRSAEKADASEKRMKEHVTEEIGKIRLQLDELKNDLGDLQRTVKSQGEEVAGLKVRVDANDSDIDNILKLTAKSTDRQAELEIKLNAIEEDGLKNVIIVADVAEAAGETGPILANTVKKCLPLLSASNLSCYRVGKQAADKTRPIKVVINDKNAEELARTVVKKHDKVAKDFKVKPFRTKLRQEVNTAIYEKLGELQTRHKALQYVIANRGFQLVTDLAGSYSYSTKTGKFELDDTPRPFVAPRRGKAAAVAPAPGAAGVGGGVGNAD